MTPRHIIIIFVRFFALVWIYYAIMAGIQVFTFSSGKPLWAIGVSMLVALGLWFYPSTVSRWVLPDYAVREADSELSRHPAPWLTTGIILIFLKVWIDGIIDSIYLGPIWYNMGSSLSFSDLNQELKAMCISTISQWIIGLFGCLFAGRISRLLRKVVR